MTTEYVIERWKPAMDYLLKKEAERDRRIERAMWWSTGFVVGMFTIAIIAMISTI